MIKITLKDPGMYDKLVKVTTIEEVLPVLKMYDHVYTTAIVRNTETNSMRLYRRNMGERNWFHPLV